MCERANLNAANSAGREIDRGRNSATAFKVLLAVFLFLVLFLVFVPIWHSVRGHSVKDYFVWYETGQAVLRAGEVYPDRFHKFPFMYPPPCALFLAPISALGQTGLVVVLALVIAAAWILSVVFAVRLVTGSWQRGDLLLYVVPSLISGAHVWGNFLLGQPSLVLLALMLGAFIALQKRYDIVAGIAVALAAAIKAFPAIALVYLIYRRFWKAAATAAIAMTFLLIILPVPFRGYAAAKQDVERWTSGMLFKYDESGVGQRLGRSNSWKNQSIWGVANRLLRHVEYEHKYEAHVPVYVNFADLPFKTVNKIILGAALVLGLTFVGVMPRRRSRTRETDAIEFALLLLLMLMFTPLSFGYLFVWLMYPFTVVTSRVVAGTCSRVLLASTIIAIALLALSIPFRVVADAYGNYLATTLLLFTGLALELWRLNRAAPSLRREATPGPTT